MANRTQALLTFATVLGMNPMTVEVILRYLAKAEMVPKGLPGRRSDHYTAIHLKNLILALAAYQPSDVVDAVQKLNSLCCHTNRLMSLGLSHLDIPGGTLFGDWIIQEIKARVSRGEHVLTSDEQEVDPRLRRGRRIIMSVSPPTATVVQPVYNNETIAYHQDSFGAKEAAKSPMPVLTREVTFTDELLNTAGDLLADTLEWQATLPTSSPSPGRTGGNNATPETTKAAGSGNHDGLLDTPASRTRRRRPLNKAQPIASQGSKQLPSATASGHSGDCVRGLGPSTHTLKVAHNGTTRIDAASP